MYAYYAFAHAVGHRIKRLCQEQSITKEALAHNMGCSTSKVGSLWRGSTDVKLTLNEIVALDTLIGSSWVRPTAEELRAGDEAYKALVARREAQRLASEKAFCIGQLQELPGQIKRYEEELGAGDGITARDTWVAKSLDHCRASLERARVKAVELGVDPSLYLGDVE